MIMAGSSPLPPPTRQTRGFQERSAEIRHSGESRNPGFLCLCVEQNEHGCRLEFILGTTEGSHDKGRFG
jgi:hypothetical protein